MIRKIRRLAAHPGFRAAPAATLARAAIWAACVTIGRAPSFRLLPGGPRLRVPPDLRYTSVGAFLLRDRVEPELAALQWFVGPRGVLVDVGANIGLFSLKAAHLVGPAGLVIAVEPGAESVGQLRSNLALNRLPQVWVVEAALADAPGEAQLHHVALGDDPQAYSLLVDESAATSETVRLTTLDVLAAEHALARLDCLKIDVEGAEPRVVSGGRATLERFRPIVIFEINAPIALRNGDAASCFNQLSSLGYKIHHLDGGVLSPVAALPPWHGNLVAVHPKGPQPKLDGQ